MRTHRALQRKILHQLDDDIIRRQDIFDTALGIVRRALPRQSIAKKGDTSLWAKNRKYLPHVISLNTAYAQSEPSMPDSLVLAELLRDAGWFLLNWEVRPDALPILEIAEKMCSNLLSTQPHKVAPLYADVLCTLASYDQYDGVKGRKRGLGRTSKAWDLREELFKSIPPSDITDADRINLGRTLGDLGCCFAQLDQIEDAGSNWQNMAHYYREAGTEKTLTVRFGYIYNNLALIRATQGNKDEARDLSNRCHELLRSELGPDHHLTVWFEFLRAFMRFGIGDLKEALKIHEEVFESRLDSLGKENHETLASQYNVALLRQRAGDLEKAEYAHDPVIALRRQI